MREAKSFVAFVVAWYLLGGAIIRAEVEPEVVSGWALLGPFESRFMYEAKWGEPSRAGFNTDFLTEAGGEGKVAFKVGDTIRADDGRELTAFKPTRVFDGGWVDEPRFSRKAGYAHTELEVEKDGTYHIFLMSHGSPKLWVNGEQVFSSWRDMHRGKKWQYSVAVELKKGKNPLLLKIDNGRGWAGFLVSYLADAEYVEFVRENLQSVVITELKREDKERISFVPRTVPEVADIVIPLNIQLRSGQGERTFMGETGQKQTLMLPEAETDSAFLRLSPVVRDEWRHVSFDRESLRRMPDEPGSDAEKEQAAVYAKLIAEFEKVRPQLEKDAPQFKPTLDWLSYKLPVMADPNNPEVVYTSAGRYAQMLIDHAKEGRNYFRDFPYAGYPCMFEAELEDGTRVRGEYYISLPLEFLLRDDHETMPVEYFLHSTYEVGRQPWFRAAKEGLVPEAKEEWSGSAYVQLYTGRNIQWDPEYLELFHQHMLDNWGIDERSVFLEGFGIGGKGILDWTRKYPHDFACIAPMAPHEADEFLKGKPLEELKVAFKGMPVWMGVHKKSADRELITNAVDELKKSGVDVQFIIFEQKRFRAMRSELHKVGLEKWQLKCARDRD